MGQLISRGEMENPDLQRITHRTAALSYFYATHIEFFTDSLGVEALMRALAANGTNASLGQLAEARRLINLATCGPAWTDISAFRVELGMPTAPPDDDSVAQTLSPRQMLTRWRLSRVKDFNRNLQCL